MSAVELLPAHEAVPSNPEWHRLRAGGVSASEIAAVLGLSKWDSEFSLYHRKVNGWDVEANDEMSTGTILEPAIADLWAYHCDPHENLTLDRAGLYAHSERPWQLVTPDRLVSAVCPTCEGGQHRPETFGCWDCRNTGCDGPPAAVLELKWTGSWDGWGEDGTDDIPVYYRAQVLWQADVLGVGQWYLGVLGPSGFRAYTGVIDRAAERDLMLMRREAATFLARLERGDPPSIDDGHAATIAALKRLHPSIEDVDVEVDQQLADGWRRARALKRRTEALCDRYEARGRALLGNGRRLVLDGRLVASRSVFDQTTDGAELTSLDTDRPTTDRLNYGKALTNA